MTTTSRDTTFLNIVRKADPDWQASRRQEVEYAIPGGRTFVANPTTRGPYTPPATNDLAIGDGFGLYTGAGDKLAWST